MASPVGDRHGDFCHLANLWLGLYSARTPGLKGGTESTVILDELNEVQPDVHLRVRPEFGGQTDKHGNFIGGCPELVLEVAITSKNYDIGPKLSAYEAAGALEMIVIAIHPNEIFWHSRDESQFVRIAPDADGIYRSRHFPGLWLNPTALFAEALPAMIETLEQGLASPEHAAFVAALEAKRTS
jgi:Uma2 family endonuclease